MDDKRIDTDSLILETQRLCRRYIQEVVLPYSLCPWAAPALTAGAVQISVITDSFSPAAGFVQAGSAVREVLAQCVDASIELVLIILPLSKFSRLEMDELLRHVRRDGVSPHEHESELLFALAAFHPDARPDASTPERFIPFLRRSPDPMIQAVRTSVLNKIDPSRGAGTSYFDLERMSLEELSSPAPEPLRTRIARTNLQTCHRVGFQELEGRYMAIMEDHRETWERLRGRNV